jgi:3-oxoacyl-[acyl-carrier protein] reductase
MRLKGKVAIITGGAGGIGKETALLFAREGAKVVVQDMNAEGARAVADEIVKAGGEAVAVTGDVTKKAECEKIVGEAVAKFGKLDILINNAGINKDAMVKKMTEDQWDAVLSVNLKGTFLMCQAALAPMSAAKYGRIVNTASIGALGNPGQANYSASKAGVIGLTCTMALEFARSNIAVNAVSPGGTETQMTAGIPADIKKMLEERVPFKRFARPSEIANAHLFLASDEASYVTGQTLFVDGGISVGI